MTDDFATEQVEVRDLRPHPRNYQVHTERQLDELMASLRLHGFYRNVIIARDSTILAGHGVVQAATRLGYDTIPAVRLDLDPDEPLAIKVLVSDNEISRLAEVDDRALTELLKQLHDVDSLIGTGFDDSQLAALVFTTRTRDEIPSLRAAEEWVGMPHFDADDSWDSDRVRLVINCRDEDAARDVTERLGVTLPKGGRVGRTIYWPPGRQDDDLLSVRYVETS